MGWPQFTKQNSLAWADMDGFKLLETVGLEMDIPVISECAWCWCRARLRGEYWANIPLLLRAVMSSNGETSTVLRGVTHGAVDFLIKPVRIEELRNVWQHVVRRKRDLVSAGGPILRELC